MNRESIIDETFIPPGKPKERRVDKVFKSILFINSMFLHTINLFYFIFWYISFKYLGWWPSYGNPDPNDFDRVPIRGNPNLKSKVILLYDYVNAVLPSYLWGFLVLCFVLLLYLVISWSRINKKVYLNGIIAFAVTLYFLFGGFMEWILD